MKINFDNTNPEHIVDYQLLPIHLFRQKYSPDFKKIRDDNPNIPRQNQLRKSNKEIYEKDNPEHVQFIKDNTWRNCIWRFSKKSLEWVNKWRQPYKRREKEWVPPRIRWQQPKEEVKEWREDYKRPEMQFSDMKPAFPNIFNKQFK